MDDDEFWQRVAAERAEYWERERRESRFVALVVCAALLIWATVLFFGWGNEWIK